MSFREIQDKFYQDAAYAIDAGLHGRNAHPVEANADLVSAGAAIALERGAPRLMALSYDNFAEDFMTHGSNPWRHFHGAVARYLDAEVNASETIPSSGEAVDMVVSDVLQRVSARHVVNAVSERNFEQFLSPPQTELVHIAKRDQNFLRDLNNIANGSFDRLSPVMAESLKIALEEPIKDKLGTEVAIAQRAVNNIVDHEEEVAQKLGVYGEVTPQFGKISRESIDKVIDYHSTGVTTGRPAIDMAFDLIAERDKLPWDLNRSDPMIIAQARLIEDNSAGFTQNSMALAAMAITDASIITNARLERETLHDNDFYKDLPADKAVAESIKLKAEGMYHLLPEDDQFRVQKEILLASQTKAIDKVRMEVDYLERVGVAHIVRAYHVARDNPNLVDQESGREKMAPMEAVKLIDAQRQAAALAQGMGY